MLIAIIAALVALVLTAAAVVIVLNMVRKNRSESVGVKKSAATIDSVGVKSTLSDYMPKHANHGTAASSSSQPVTVPADVLRPRFLAMGALVAGVFATLLAKLWSMQILAGSKYASESEENRYSVVSTPAPRGYVYDADGLALVKNRSSLTVLADPDVADNRDVLLRLSTVLGVPYNVVRQRVKDASSGAQSQRVVASDARMRDVAFISEHADAFPGVTVETRAVRDYPYGALAAHALGYTGSVSEDELGNMAAGRDIELGDDVGKSGVESTYDNLIAGDHGQRKVMADSKGNVVEVVSETQPTRGSDVYLCIKGPVQYAADKALAELIAPDDGVIGSGAGTAGAVVVLDIADGGIVAMSSYPTFAPSTFTGGIPQEVWDLYNTEESHYPLMNRAISGSYPAASTYKAFTSMAALEYGFATDTSTWTCTGSWDGWNTGQPQMCWEHSGHGTLDLYGGIVNSCDVVFYEIAKAFWDNQETVGETALQDYLRKFRFGEYTGIDLSGEAQGRIPTPEWKAEHFADYPEEAVWKGGDMTNMIIGQGYVLTTPLQIACAYAAIATGTMMKPHLLKEVRNASGEVVLSFEPEVLTEIDVNTDDLALVRRSLRGVATDNSYIAKVLNDYGIQAACKTGTAEVAGKEDYAWFAMYAPYDDPKYVVACIVEEGGGGSDTAMPLGAAVMNAVLAYDRGELDEMGRIAGSTGKSVEPAAHVSSGRTD
ncbi:penicillin-binding protein 2 [Adlercreutzia sp. ZJ141]|uniref:penicillin-binding protein 2 n=1 Tax=Adlercreutzia sp. ZJ141 TaxID=2709406 RepID=UPI0013ED593B|nr:penicillin-binding protein 2 [Adlercreutzia sp. ZJ141]